MAALLISMLSLGAWSSAARAPESVTLRDLERFPPQHVAQQCLARASAWRQGLEACKARHPAWYSAAHHAEDCWLQLYLANDRGLPECHRLGYLRHLQGLLRENWSIKQMPYPAPPNPAVK